ncbi:arylsulfotransferase family protein [Actinomadura sp. WMMA1423]|uniref:arylsulfotransferase family protein n=1 Tax=Actinomadura sp. WMMA1423 TaxID=2591108 RepID=UPI00197A93D5|nr:arylsulfotransferase family protein [Actinomadura sp. WMMA1423]
MIGARLRSPALVLGGVVALSSPAAASIGPGTARAASVRAGTAAPALPAPPRYRVLTNRPGASAGLLFTGPVNLEDFADPHGAEIIDGLGRPVWFRRLRDGIMASDLRVQSYRGRPVLTWWEGTYPGGGVGYVADEHYRVVAVIKGVAAPVDAHEFRLTSRGTVLITENRNSPRDLSPFGGAKDGTVVGGIVEEIDVATGRSLWRWSSLAHVGLAESYGAPHRANGRSIYDYAHLNSVDEGPDGSLLISARNTSAIYKLDRRTGRIVWRLGGRRSTFRLGPGVRLSGQHDAVWAGRNLIRVFENGTISPWKGPSDERESRVLWVRIDPVRKTASLVRQVIHPQHLSAALNGGAQDLPNGHTVVGWGSTGRISEFSRQGDLLFDASLPGGWTSYRVYRSPWNGRPSTPPSAVVQAGAVHAVWNGATGVARWEVLAGGAPDALKPVAAAAWSGLDTSIALPAAAGSARYVKVRARDAGGKVLGTSGFARRP